MSVSDCWLQFMYLEHVDENVVACTSLINFNYLFRNYDAFEFLAKAKQIFFAELL